VGKDNIPHQKPDIRRKKNTSIVPCFGSYGHTSGGIGFSDGYNKNYHSQRINSLKFSGWLRPSSKAASTLSKNRHWVGGPPQNTPKSTRFAYFFFGDDMLRPNKIKIVCS
jgi:hypothetical protein